MWFISVVAVLHSTMRDSEVVASGQSVTVTVSANDLLTVGGQLTVNPGGITVSVVLGTGIG